MVHKNVLRYVLFNKNMNPDHFLKNNSKNDMNPDYFLKPNSTNDLKIFLRCKKKKRHCFPPTYKYESISFHNNKSKNDINPDHFLKTNSKNDLKISMVHKNVLHYVLLKLKYHSQNNNSENDITYHFLTNNSKNDMNQYHF